MTEAPTANVPSGVPYDFGDLFESNFWQVKGIRFLANYVHPVIYFFGIIGNLMTLAVLITKQFRKSPSSLILGALTLSDTAVLLSALHLWCEGQLTPAGTKKVPGAALCARMYFIYFLSYASPAFLVILTVERAISVFFPLKCREICSRRRVLLCIITVTVLLGLIYLIPVFGATGDIPCSILPGALRDAWLWIDSSFAVFIPFFLITFGNIFIVTKLSISRKKLSIERSGEERTSSVTVMLIGVSACFLALNAPRCVFMIGTLALDDAWSLFETTEGRLTYQFILSFSGIGFYVNSAINFIMYCLTGSKFRRALKDLFAMCSCSCKQ